MLVNSKTNCLKDARWWNRNWSDCYCYNMSLMLREKIAASPVWNVFDCRTLPNNINIDAAGVVTYVGRYHRSRIGGWPRLDWVSVSNFACLDPMIHIFWSQYLCFRTSILLNPGLINHNLECMYSNKCQLLTVAIYDFKDSGEVVRK